VTITAEASKSATGIPQKRRGVIGFCFLLGTVFGVILTKSEVVSWFRIQEMFRFQSFHMYGILGSAFAVAGISVTLLNRYHVPTIDGQPIVVPPKIMTRWGTRYWAGGTLFGLGWALTGACPGPTLALVGSAAGVMLVAAFSALVGTWVYGWVRPMLPH